MRADATYVIPEELAGKRLDAAVRALAGTSWSEARSLVETGKVQVGGTVATAIDRSMRPGETVAIVMRAPRPATARRLDASALVYVDPHVVVVKKPAGVSTVPFEEGERGTLDQLVAALLHKADRRGGPPSTLGVVQRLDKETTGLLVFARTFAAKKALGNQLRTHSMHRRYVAIVHGTLEGSHTYESHFVPDRGDGLRGSTSFEGRGQLAVTHVEAIEALRGATLVGCRLETGRTHQIRIHLAEAGYPLLGERVYTRRFTGPIIASPRVMLHAAELGFVHPQTGREMRFEEPMPDDMRAMLESLR